MAGNPNFAHDCELWKPRDGKGFRRRALKKLPQVIQARAHLKLVLIHRAENLEDLRLPPSNHLEALLGNLAGYHSIRINNQWRIIFKWNEDGNAEDVEILDYH